MRFNVLHIMYNIVHYCIYCKLQKILYIISFGIHVLSNKFITKSAVAETISL